MKILLATDGSEFSFEAAKKSCEMISFGKDTEIRIICVVETTTPILPFGVSKDYYDSIRKAELGAAEDAVEETRRIMYEMLGETETDIKTIVISGIPKEKILKEAENWEADLIVVGSHGRGFWGRNLLGSVSDAIVKYAPCSVLVVRKDKIDKQNEN